MGVDYEKGTPVCVPRTSRRLKGEDSNLKKDDVLVFKVHRLLYHSTPGSRVAKKKKARHARLPALRDLFLFVASSLSYMLPPHYMNHLAYVTNIQLRRP